MRKIIVLNYASLDGFIAKRNEKNADWIVWDDRIDDYYAETQNDADTMIFGRTTFQGMKDYWATSESKDEKPGIVRFMNETKKIVFSKSLTETGWENSELRREIVASEIEELKKQTGKNIIIYGSASIVSQLTKRDLIDEYRIMLNPVVLGGGKPYFEKPENILRLNLIETKTFDCGTILLRYQSKKV